MFKMVACGIGRPVKNEDGKEKVSDINVSLWDTDLSTDAEFMDGEQDKKLIERLQEGSKEAFHSLFKDNGPGIYAFALSYLRNQADAEELLQEVFLKLWEIRGSLDAGRNVKSLLFRICINLIYDFIRRKNVERAYLDYSVGNVQVQSDDTWQEVVYQDLLENLRGLVEAMPAQRQRIFRLSKEEGLSNGEIARKLGLSQRTVENHLHLAVSWLKEKLGTGSLPALLFFFLHCA